MIGVNNVAVASLREHLVFKHMLKTSFISQMVFSNNFEDTVIQLLVFLKNSQ